MEHDLTAQIRALAYQIWEMEGRPTGRERIHWLRAEAEVREKFQPHGDAEGRKTTPYRVVARTSKKAPPLPLHVRHVHVRYERLARS
jgi:hypothetical protein